MKKEQNIPTLRLLSLIVIAYLLMAFTWWSVLLFKKNRDAFDAKQELLRLEFEEGRAGVVHYRHTTAYRNLEYRYKRQEWMILGEALVFVLSLGAGIWFINRGYQKQVNAARSQRNFLLSITHELKSPLASIRLVMETLLRRDLEREQVLKLGSSALQETKRLNALVDNLLLSARLDTAYRPERTSVHLGEVVLDLIAKLGELYPGARIFTDIEADMPSWQGDKAGFTSIALNLLENAVKYSTKGVDISVSLYYQQQPAGFVFSVADKGLGIPDAEKRRIFDKFYRIGNEEQRSSKGAGLGLYIVDQIARAHGGRVKVSDNAPTGTVFQVFLPDV